MAPDKCEPISEWRVKVGLRLNINAGTPFKDIVEQIDVVRLTKMHRQNKDWQKQASLGLTEQCIQTALNAYEVHGYVQEACTHQRLLPVFLRITW